MTTPIAKPALNPDHHFKKGWPDDELWWDYWKAVLAADDFKVSQLVKTSGSFRLPVDPLVFSIGTDPIHPGSLPAAPAPYGAESEELKQQFGELLEFEAHRDTPLADLPEHFPLGLRKMSRWLPPMVPVYAPGVDYMAEQEEYDHIASGGAVQARDVWRGVENRSDGLTPRAVGFKKIETIRDLVAYVHNDPPEEGWFIAVMELKKLGCPMAPPRELQFLGSQAATSTSGPIWAKGIMGEVLRLTGLFTFRAKYEYMLLRPEEYGDRIAGRLLSQAYPEGSPMHPSYPSGHSCFALAMKYVILFLYDPNFVLPDGTTVEYQAELLADNIGFARCAAGVHYRQDHEGCEAVVEAIARFVTRQCSNGTLFPAKDVYGLLEKP
jgi:hypothetical protein